MLQEGIEPPLLTEPDPKSGAATNYATGARNYMCFWSESNRHGHYCPRDFKSLAYYLFRHRSIFYCTSDWIRTNDPQLRRLVLYPAELPKHILVRTYPEPTWRLMLTRQVFFQLNYTSKMKLLNYPQSFSTVLAYVMNMFHIPPEV